MVQKKKCYKTNFYKRILNNFILKGKKVVVKNLFDKTLTDVAKILKISTLKLLFKIYLKLNSFIEIKRVNIKRRSYVIPFSVPYSRRVYLIAKRLKTSIRSDKRKISYYEKLKSEIYNLFLMKLNSRSLKLLKSNQTQIRVSRSNIHFRWK